MRISSAKSDRVSAVRALHARAGRRKAGLFLVEGPQAVTGALASAAPVREVIVDESADLDDVVDAARAAGVPVTLASSAAIAAMAETEHPQGVLATCALLTPADPRSALDRVMAGSGPVLVLDGVADPGNAGSAIRTADALGAAGVILTPGSVDVHNGKVVRSTAGSLFHLSVVPEAPWPWIVEAARRHQRAVVVTSGDGEHDLFDAVDARLVCSRTCWVVGSEAHGVSLEARQAADLSVRIPMSGRLESLNAAVAAAVVLYVTEHGSRGSGDSGPGPR